MTVKERKRKRKERKENSLNTNLGTRICVRTRCMDVLACGCVACGSAMRVDENKCKGKERKKKLT